MKQLMWLSLALVFLIAASPAEAKSLTAHKTDFQLTVPDDWTVAESPHGSGYAYLATSADESKHLSVYIVQLNSPGPLNDDSDYVKGFVKSTETHNVSIIKREHQKLNGIDFYVFRMAPNPKATVANMSVWMTQANGQVYQIALFTKDVESTKSPELLAALNSFTFAKK